MKILLVIPTLKQGGAERVISELANEFVSQGYSVHLALLAESSDFYSVSSSVSIHRLGFRNTGFMKKIISEITTFFKLRILMAKIQPNSTLCFMLKYNVFTILASIGMNTKVYVSERSNPFKPLGKKWIILRKLVYSQATGIIAQTSIAHKVMYEQTKHHNIHTIPNPVRKLKQYKNTHRENIILNIGRMVPEKNQIELIKIFAETNSKNWRLVILGDGPLRQTIEKLVAVLNLTEKVLLPGSVVNVDEWIANSSIFALTSISEGFPNALLEAMAGSLYCISYDCYAGPRDLIQNRINGCLIPIGNNSLYRDTLIEMMSSENTCTIRENANNVAKLYDIKTISEQYLKVLYGKA